MSRDYDPVRGQWYQNIEEEETFRVLSVDEDSELIEIQYTNGETEELDLESWAEMDLELTTKPEGWASDEAEGEEEDEEDDEEDDDWDEDEDDEDDDDDDDWEEDEEDSGSY